MCIEKREAQIFYNEFFFQKAYLIWDGGSINGIGYPANKNRHYRVFFKAVKITAQTIVRRS